MVPLLLSYQIEYILVLGAAWYPPLIRQELQLQHSEVLNNLDFSKIQRNSNPRAELVILPAEKQIGREPEQRFGETSVVFGAK